VLQASDGVGWPGVNALALGGMLTFGGYDSSHFEGSLEYIPLTNATYWQVVAETRGGGDPIFPQPLCLFKPLLTLVCIPLISRNRLFFESYFPSLFLLYSLFLFSS